MAMTVNTNVSALVAQRHLNSASEMLNQSLERLSSGNLIISAKDDEAGLQISIVWKRNAWPWLCCRQCQRWDFDPADGWGAMQETTQLLQRMRDLSLQSADGSNSAAERVALQEEMAALNDELNQIAETTSLRA